MFGVRSIVLLAASVQVAAVLGQSQGLYPSFIEVRVENGDTLPTILLREQQVDGFTSAKARRAAMRFDRLVRNVQKVYPYARVSAQLLQEYEHDLSAIQNGHDQDLYVKLAEAELRAEFGEELKGLTVSQGRVLIKLVDRETGHTSYELVKELRGNFQAFIWQGLARLFGNDLKDEYDPLGDEAAIEAIVQRIERGELGVTARGARTAKAQARLEKRRARLYKKYGLPVPDTSMN
ncbi:MAG: DUF4294 domain-containing protein [Flavobacteriales bacterium]